MDFATDMTTDMTIMLMYFLNHMRILHSNNAASKTGRRTDTKCIILAKVINLQYNQNTTYNYHVWYK